MTEQSKIPLPPEGEGPRGNSIERAVEKFELGKFNPPPIPGGLEPRRPRRPVRLPAIDLMPAPAPQPVAAPAPAPVAAPVAEAPSQPAAVAQAAPQPAASPEPEPVRFRGKKYKVNRKRLREQGLIQPEGAVTGLLEEFRIVKRQLLVNASDLRRQGSGAAAQRILVSSPHPNEGKSYCAVNLALSIAAEMESEVLLVDADFAKPSLPKMLGLPDGPGLLDALTDPNKDPADFVLGTDIPGLWVLPAGSSKTNADTEYLGSSRGGQVLDRLTQGAPHRIVLFDSPPALAASPAAALAKYVGQVMLVVRADQTGQGALEDAISLLSACPNIQLLLNAANFSPSGRTFGAYHGYGE
ncbi:MAG: capsular biosynthesis protein [Novosphingobium sp.]|nr:capsular biosynthesis protein [Novosphingobium sp.]